MGANAVGNTDHLIFQSGLAGAWNAIASADQGHDGVIRPDRQRVWLDAGEEAGGDSAFNARDGHSGCGGGGVFPPVAAFDFNEGKKERAGVKLGGGGGYAEGGGEFSNHPNSPPAPPR